MLSSRNNRWTFGSALTRSPPVAAPLRISVRRVRRWGAPRLASVGENSPTVQVWLSGALFRLRKRKSFNQIRTERVNVENKGIVPFLNERVIYQARHERVNARYGVLFRLLMGVSRVQARSLILHVIPKQERVGTIGDGVKPGNPPAVGLGGANVQMWACNAHI